MGKLDRKSEKMNGARLRRNHERVGWYGAGENMIWLRESKSIRRQH